MHYSLLATSDYEEYIDSYSIYADVDPYRCDFDINNAPSWFFKMLGEPGIKPDDPGLLSKLSGYINEQVEYDHDTGTYYYTSRSNPDYRFDYYDDSWGAGKNLVTSDKIDVIPCATLINGVWDDNVWDQYTQSGWDNRVRSTLAKLDPKEKLTVIDCHV